MCFGQKKRAKAEQTSAEVMNSVISKKTLEEQMIELNAQFNRPEVQELLVKGCGKFKHQNEEAVKFALIQPFIAALGYDGLIEIRPEVLVVPEDSKSKKVDYAIYSDNKAIILVEAKAYEVNLDKAASKAELSPYEQLADYFVAPAFPDAEYAILTNGREWRIYCNDAYVTVTSQERKMSKDACVEFSFGESFVFDPLIANLSRNAFAPSATIPKVADERKAEAAKVIVSALSSISEGSSVIDVIRECSGLSNNVLSSDICSIINSLNCTTDISTPASVSADIIDDSALPAAPESAFETEATEPESVTVEAAAEPESIEPEQAEE